jgi:hypothetical protein
LRAKGFSCISDVLYEGLGIIKIPIFSKNINFFPAVKFSNFWFKKLWYSAEMPDPNPDSMNPDPKHCP